MVKTCAFCEKTDGMCYTSNPPKIKCTITGKFHEYDHICDVPITNADRIRAMSDEELAEAFWKLADSLQTGAMDDLSCLFCDGKNSCVDKNGDITCTPDMEKACVLRWLRQPAKEDENE